MIGVLNINKPHNWTSRDVVNRVQRIVSPIKSGDAGPLDPLASGVLVVCVGSATKLISHVQQMPKQYQATVLLGQTSPSEDTETETTPVPSAPEPTRLNLESQLPNFLGTIMQRPPAYSALKLQGQRSYALARQGLEIKLKSRPIKIYSLEITKYAYPELQLSIRCGSGTYVRSLGRDLAESLGTGAVMSALTRTAIGSYCIADALDPHQIQADLLPEQLLSPLTTVAHLPRVTLNEEQVNHICHGRLIESKRPTNSNSDILVATDSKDNLIALLRERKPGMLGPTCNFKPPA
ncbi:MAG: tRNA pseudouridine(55) synthase TruB [Pirellulales bacterium]|nr:tRNA pseudouridine(55) synthase TruB [Pirellulales bacterium]